MANQQARDAARALGLVNQDTFDFLKVHPTPTTLANGDIRHKDGSVESGAAYNARMQREVEAHVQRQMSDDERRRAGAAFQNRERKRKLREAATETRTPYQIAEAKRQAARDRLNGGDSL